MCGRYSFTIKDTKKLKKRFDLKKITSDLTPRFNIAPSQSAPVILNQSPETLSLIRWGLIPHWAKEEKIGYKMINARAETIAEKPSFKGPLKSKRCLVLADSFYEWKKVDGKKRPFRIMLKDGEIFALAGIWDCWQNQDKELLTFAIITTSPNSLMKSIHDRMPVIIAQENEREWLSDIDTKNALKLLKPFSANKMEAYEISTIINSPRHDSSEVIKPLNLSIKNTA